jgi:hypothetical protein
MLRRLILNAGGTAGIIENDEFDGNLQILGKCPAKWASLALKYEHLPPILRLGIHPEVERPPYFEQINAFDCRRDQEHPAFRIPTVHQSLDEEHNLA